MAEMTETKSRNRQRSMVRRARISDLDRLIEIEQACFSSDRLSRRSFSRQIGSPRSAVFVATAEDRIAGYAMILFRSTSAIARLYSLAVDPAFRGRSVGRILVDEAERIAIGRGADRLRLEVRLDNMAARSLYVSAGYQEIRDLPRYYADGGDGIRYEKVLTNRRTQAR
jgi:ribosomal-protein-alanine N-acetyltransferase